MKMRNTVLRVTLFALLVGAVATVPAVAGSAVVGSVAGSMNATVGGQSLLPNTTIFSGDSLQVRDGVAVIAVGNNGRLVVGRDTVASFLKDSNEITVLLTQGNVSMLHPNDAAVVRVKAGQISVTPAPGFKTLGEVAMLNGSVIVTAKEGALKVDNHGVTKDVAKGQTIVLTPRTANNKGSGNAGWGNTSDMGFDIAILGAAGAGAILAGVGMSRAGSANNNALDAINAANQANSTAAAAASAASAAAAAASAAQILAECSYDMSQTGTLTSPYVLGSSVCSGQ